MRSWLVRDLVVTEPKRSSFVLAVQYEGRLAKAEMFSLARGASWLCVLRGVYATCAFRPGDVPGGNTEGCASHACGGRRRDPCGA